MNPIDSFLTETIAALEAAIPGQVHSCYLLGSYAEGYAVPLLSDIDLLVVLKGSNPKARTEASRVVKYSAARSSVRLDVILRDEAELRKLHSVLQRSLKSGSRLLYGQDVRPTLPEIPLEAFRWAAWDGGALHFVLHILRGIDRSGIPLGYPEADSEFFGYDRIRVREWYPPEFQQGTKELVATVSRLCSALLADQAQVQAAGKSEAFRLYADLIGDEWMPMVNDIFKACKLDWHYRVPANETDRNRLRTLCERTVEFENFALERCWRYFDALSNEGDQSKQAEVKARLQRLAARDAE